MVTRTAPTTRRKISGHHGHQLCASAFNQLSSMGSKTEMCSQRSFANRQPVERLAVLVISNFLKQ